MSPVDAVARIFLLDRCPSRAIIAALLHGSPVCCQYINRCRSCPTRAEKRKHRIMLSPLRIGLMAEARYMSQSQPTGLKNVLEARGHHISLIDPQQSFYVMGEDHWLTGLDLIVGRGRSWGLLGLLGW